MQLDEHLFRHQAGRLVAALTRVFGVHNLALAEDVAQDALCRALEVWKFSGVPDNPSAWLLTTAKRRALDVLRRERTARTFAPEVGWMLESEWTAAPALSELLAPAALRDDALRLMLSCCQPRLPEEVQVALVLNLSCGFRAREIANAFLCSEAAIEKRLARGKKVLAGARTLFDLSAPWSDGELTARIGAAQRALYLLFNEGYHGGGESAVRVELCHEAMRLVALLVDHPPAATPTTLALAALMCLTAARLPARLDSAGDLIPLDEQLRDRWDQSLVEKGRVLLARSAVGDEVTEFHVQAAIAAVHAQPTLAATERWERIVALYDALLLLAPSPVVALQRALAVGQVAGPQRGLEELSAIADKERLDRYPFYFAALGELTLRAGRPTDARAHFAKALERTRNGLERRHIEARLAVCSATRA